MMLSQLRQAVNSSVRRLAFWPFRGGRDARLPLDGRQFSLSPSYRTTEEAANHSAVFACVNLLCRVIAGSAQVAVYRNDADQRQKLGEHPAASLVDRSPNPDQTGYVWMEQVIRSICHHGNAISIIERDPDGMPIGLWPVPPTHVTIGCDGQRIWYEVRVREERKPYHPSDVLHFALITDDGIRGLSILSAARRTVELAIEQEAAGLNFYQQNASPTGVITVPHRMNDIQSQRLREGWEAIYSGGRRRVALLEEGVTFTPISVTFEDAEWVKSRAMTGEDIARYFGIPPSLIGYTERSSYSSGEVGWQAFIATTVGPWLRMIESELNRKLLGPGEEFFHDTSRLVLADTASRYAAYASALQTGWMTPNEVRRTEGLAPIDGGGQLRTPTWLQSQQERQ